MATPDARDEVRDRRSEPRQGQGGRGAGVGPGTTARIAWPCVAIDCPACKTPGGLRAVRRLALEGDASSDEIVVELLVCDACGRDRASAFEASRRGALETDASRRSFCEADADALDRLDDAIAACPSPLEPACPCLAHAALGETDVKGRWIGLRAALEVLARATASAFAAADDDGSPCPPTSDPLVLASETPVVWRCTPDVDRPYGAVVAGRVWSLALGDFPDEPLYTLEIDGEAVGSLVDWPSAWARPDSSAG